jgi:DNA replication protein DnaC
MCQSPRRAPAASPAETTRRPQAPLVGLTRPHLRPRSLLDIDELGFVPLSKTGAELLFELISQRYERGATLITGNLPFDEWTEVFGSERLTGALLDRLTTTSTSSR